MSRSAITVVAVSFLVTLSSVCASAQEVPGYWPQWRGPNRDNLSTDDQLRTEWPTDGPPLEWVVSGIGEGIAAVAVSDGRVIVLGDIDGEEFVTALDERTGTRLWATAIGPAVDLNGLTRLMRWLSQRTPTLDSERLYAITAEGVLACLDVRNGSTIWHTSYPDQFGSGRRVWGFCDYPLVEGDTLICLPLGRHAGIVALNRFNGAMIWQQPFEEERHPAYGALIPAELAGTRQYVVALAEGIAGFSAADGTKLWWHPNRENRWPTTHTLILPGDGSLVCPFSYGRGVTRFEPHREGDVWAVREQYYQPASIDAFQDGAVALNNYVYAGAARAGMLVCIDMRTGEIAWTSPAETERNENDGTPSARSGPPNSQESQVRRGRSRLIRVGLTLADGHLYCLQANGVLRLVSADSTGYVEKSSFSIPEFQPAAGATLPVVTAGHLYIRDNDRLLCFHVQKDGQNVVRGEHKRIVLAKPESQRTGRKPPVLRPIFVSTPNAVVDQMLEAADIRQDTVVVDLGSGDGRIVIAAAKKYGCHAIGYEIDPDLIRESRASLKADGLSQLVTIRDQDMFTADLSGVDVVTTYLNSSVLEKMRPQFEQMKPGAHIVSHFFKIPGVEPSEHLTANSDSGEVHEVIVYVTPLKYDKNASKDP